MHTHFRKLSTTTYSALRIIRSWEYYLPWIVFLAQLSIEVSVVFVDWLRFQAYFALTVVRLLLLP